MFARLAVVCVIGTIAVILSVCSGHTTSDECDPGDWSSCESQCGPGTMRCLPGGFWDICQPDRAPDCVPGEYGSCSFDDSSPPGLWICSDDCRVGPCIALCMPGDSFECEAQCGRGQMYCQDDGTWGECEEYIIPSCRPGDIERCEGGSGHRRCSDSCRWDTCDDSSCAPGEVADCGSCALQVCLSEGSWGECAGAPRSSCSPDEVEACDAPCGPGERRCTDECEWTECWEVTPVECHPGDEKICPDTLYCGYALRICNEFCEFNGCFEVGD